MRYLIIVLIVLGNAQTTEADGTLTLPLSILAAAGTTDIVSTFTGGANYERNPVISWMQPSVGFKGTVAIGAAVEVATVLVLCKLLCKSRPRLARTLMYIGSGIHATAAIDNFRRH